MTQKQFQILTFIGAFIKANGYPPTTREIQAHFGYSSQNSAMNHLRALKRKKALSWKPGQARTLRVL